MSDERDSGMDGSTDDGTDRPDGGTGTRPALRVPRVWGAREDEVRAEYPCDGLLDRPRENWFRAVTVDAAPATVFRWLCQLKVAPYSYDVLDNPGHRSPRRLTPGVEQLAPEQRVMKIFRLVDFAQDRHLTLLLDHPKGRTAFGEFAVTYRVTGEADGRTRLVVKLVVGGDEAAAQRLRRSLMAWGDLLMMRRQLLTLRKLSERQERQERS